MVEKIQINGYDEFKKYISDLKTDKEVNILFTGVWCSDCVEAKPFLAKALETVVSKDSVYVTVDVGDRPTWKDMKNPFRLDKQTHLMVIPTLIKWGQPQRLEGDQLTKDDLLEMFFSNDD